MRSRGDGEVVAVSKSEVSVSTARAVEEVVVDLGPRSYPVVVGADVLGEVGPRVAALGYRGGCALVTSAQVGALYAERVVRSLRSARLEPAVVEIADGEEQKTLAAVAAVYDRLLAAGVDRRSPVVVLGGGVLGDLVGFAGATLFRGLPTVLVPTTLLAQVDAAVGGKTGVNHARGKNLIGAFHQPRLVVADVEVLRTLPRREFVAGLAEVIKYGAIGDAALFRRIEDGLTEVLRLGAEALVPLVATCCRQKAAVVSADEREETGSRAVLNFGHTVGHAIEALTAYRTYLHGEAVAIGMAAAARVSCGLGRCNAETVERLERVLKRAGLPTAMPAEITAEAVAGAMQHDKKSAGGRIRFVALQEIGRTAFVELSRFDIVKYL